MAPTVLSNPVKSSLEKKGKHTHKASSSSSSPSLPSSSSAKNQNSSNGGNSKSSRNGDSQMTVLASPPPPPPLRTKLKSEKASVAVTANATATTTTTTNKKANHHSPFRVKVGCVVALRFRSSGNGHNNKLSVVSDSQSQVPAPFPVISQTQSVSPKTRLTTTTTTLTLDDSLLSVWTNPLPGRDSGLALIGKNVRCFFPKEMMQLQKQPSQQSQQSQQPQQQNKETKRRVLEGEIVSLTDYGRMRRRGRAIRVGLLVDKNEYRTHFSFLQRLDEDVDVASLPTKKARRTQKMEESIRGINKVIVHIKLSNPATMDVAVAASSNDNSNNNENSVRWVIQKQVPPKLFHNKPPRKRSLSPPTVVASEKVGDPANTEEGTTGGHSSTFTNTTTSTNGATTTGATTPKAERTGTGAGATNAVVVNGKNHNTGQQHVPSKAPASSEPPKKRRKLNNNNNANTVLETKHVGDGNDPQEQQISNWRWLAGRYHDLLLSLKYDSVDLQGADVLSAGLVGEVLKVEASPDSSSLAVVTLRRLFLPEHTAAGRLPHHGPFDIFANHDHDIISDTRTSDNANAGGPTTAESSGGGAGIRIQVPVENLIIISRRVEKTWDHAANNQGSKEVASLDQLQVSHAYSLRNDTYFPLVRSTAESNNGVQPSAPLPSFNSCCHRCRKAIPEAEATACTSNSCPLAKPGIMGASTVWWCESCLEVLRSVCNLDQHDDGVSALPCCLGLCDCRSCRLLAGSELHEELWTSVADAAAAAAAATTIGNNGVTPEAHKPLLLSALSSISSVGPIDFDLPGYFVESSTLPVPTGKPATRVKARSPKKLKRQQSLKGGKASSNKTGEKRVSSKTNGKATAGTRNGQSGIVTSPERPSEDYSVFKPSCSRLVPYNPTMKDRTFTADSLPGNTEKPRNLRQTLLDRFGDGEKDDKTSLSRAARANQRRIMKGVAAIGVTSFGLDTLASREPQLRFDRSGIHAWGVFADEDIATGEMIVEYRGELIGNAMAEKREKEYEAAKIGSDYMFRVDALNVCDATKQGNVARFLNASCGPNCYTKIITLDGNKRIVIYTKRDITAGEELCYDYKFPLEYDESERIPCHCGTKECRGFMNWDKRYVALPASLDERASPGKKPWRLPGENSQS